MKIHKTAVVGKGAVISESAEIGPYCIIGPQATIADNVVLKSHVNVTGRTEIGARTVVHAFASLGEPPQHLGYNGEATSLVIGEGNVIREHVTMNTGTAAGRGETRIGDNGFFMTACHVAHDCVIGDNVIMANNATLGGHVLVEDGAFLGGICAIHQYCRVGAYAFIGGCAAVPTDVIPYGSASGNHAVLSGLNIVGLKRRGLDRAAIHDLRAAYRLLFGNNATFQERIAETEEKYGHTAEVARVLEFIKTEARRPLMTPER